MKPVVPPSKLPLRALFAEALAGILQRPGRTALTALGTVLGIGALVAVLGLTATATGQISQRFTTLTATEVSVERVEGENMDAQMPFPPDADRRMRALNGVNHAGVTWRLPDEVARTVRGVPVPGEQPDVFPTLQVASAGYLGAVLPRVSQGRLYDDAHEDRGERVVVLGKAAARMLGVHTLSTRPAITIDGMPFTVIGVLDDVGRNASVLSSVLVPRRTAEEMWPVTGEAAELKMLVDTQLGAATVIARQAPVALRPDAPELFRVVPPPDPRGLRDAVGTDLNALFLLLAVVCLVIGTVGIANTTLVAVLERTGEIGLRRALGARPRHITGQFLTEAAVVGTLGGLIGTTLGIMTTVVVAAVKQWTPLLEPLAVLPAPFVGTLTGLAAGLYPALRAARIEPVQALQR